MNFLVQDATFHTRGPLSSAAWRAVCAVSLAMVLSAWGAIDLAAQSYQGAVRGRVIDPNGGVIPGATVTLKNTATNVARTTVSNESGLYLFSSVDPASYVLTAESPGFKVFERQGIAVQTQQFIDVDVPMELGEVTEVVTVTETVPVIESATASGGTVLENQQLMDLPNSGRNPFMMSMITPGVVPSGNPQFNRMQDQSGSSQITIAGGPVRGNNYYLDGVPITDVQNRAIIIPTIESVMDVKVQSNTYDAEMGRTGGGTFNTTLKSGTNVLHGTAFGLIREKELTANNFFNNRVGRERPDTPYRNYGGSIGGPIWIPKLYNGTDRTFFHVAAEGYDQKSSLVQTFAVPTAAERGGDFSGSFNSNGALRTIYDPLSTTRGADGTVSRQPFANNVIPGDRLSPIGLSAAGYYAAPNVSGRSYGQDNFNSEEVISDLGRQMAFKVDHEFIPRFRMNASYLHYKSREPGAPHQGYPVSPTGTWLDRKVDATQINAILTPDATTVISVRWGFNRFPNVSTNIALDGGFSASQLGFSPDFVQGRQIDGFPEFQMQQFADAGRGGLSDTKFYSRNFLTSVSKFQGRHNLKFGFDFRQINQDFLNYPREGSGQFIFDDDFSRRVPGVSDNTGSEIANLLLGYPRGGSVALTTAVESFVNYYAGYVQDDFRITPDLTLNLGLRVEYETGLREKNNNFTVDFDQSVVSPISNDQMTAHGGLIFAGENGAPTEQGNTGLRLGPRFGLAWKLNEKTVIRGGAGLFWAPVRVENSAEGVGAIGFTQSTPYVGSNDGGLTPAHSLSNPYPDGFQQPTGASDGLLTGIGSTIGFANPDRRGALVKQFSIDIQRELPGEINVTLAYIGSRSSRLNHGSIGDGYFNINALAPEFFSQGNSLLGAVPNPFFGQGGTGVVGGSTVASNQLLRPFPQFNQVRHYYGDRADAKYDSLVVRAQRRLSQGLTFLSSLTWSRAFTSVYGNTNSLMELGTPLVPQNPYDLEAEYGPDGAIAPLRFVLSATYDLPFGRGKPYLNSNPVLRAIAGGWQFNAVGILQSGFPLSLTQANNLNSPLGYDRQRPNATGVSPEVDAPLSQRLDGWINPDAFSTAGRFEFGNVARAIGMRGPGIALWDVSLFKTFTILERFKAQWRTEFINVFNTPHFQGPNAQVGGSRFGTIAQQRNFPRIVQLGIRFIW